MNYVFQNRKELAGRHYIRKADPGSDYWVDFSATPLAKYQQQFGDQFCLVIFGRENIAGDFFAIPYRFVADLFTEATQTRDKNGRSRWVGNIVNFSLRISNTGQRRDVNEFYGRPDVMMSPEGGRIDIDSTDNDYAIENRRAEVNVRGLHWLN